MADNSALAGLMARPEATQNYVSMADAMRNRALLPAQLAQLQQQTSSAQTGQQLTQQQVQAQQLENQQHQIALQDQQRQMEYWANPDKYEEEAPTTQNTAPSEPQGGTLGSAMTGNPIAAGSTPQAPPKVNFAEQMLGLASDDPLAKQANGMIRAGVTPSTVAATAQSLIKFRADVLKQTADKQEMTKNGLAEINKILAPIGAEQDFAKKQSMLQAAEPELQKASAFDPSLHQAIMQADALHVDKILNLTGGMQDVLEFGTKKAENEEKLLKTEPPTDQQRKDVLATVTTYSHVDPQLRAGIAQEVKNAKTFGDLKAVEQRADEFEKAGQMHDASLAQAKAMVGNKFGEAGLTENDKIWTDMQHGFAGTLAQLQQTKRAIVAGADGNGLMTSLTPTMEVLGIGHAAGINRVPPSEAQAAGAPGSWAEKWNAWATKAASGKLTPELAKEGNELTDILLDGAHKKALTSSALIAKGHGLTPDQTPAMDRDGNLTTLDKVMGKRKSEEPEKKNTPPTGATHKVMGPDKKMHYTNAQGTVDYGLVP